MTRLCALLGDPVAHSASPAMHNAAFAREGVDAVYLAFRVGADAFAAAVRGLAALGAAGANVTIPHKERALRLADQASELARRTGAANVLAFREGRILADNTDVPGFLASLEEAGIALRGQRVAVLGAGGAARAVVVAALDAGAEAVTVVARSEGRAAELVRDLGGGGRLQVRPWGPRAGAALPPGCSVVVNCTPLGMHPGDPVPVADLGQLEAGAAVVDLIYNPPETPLLREARARGLRAAGGGGMLVWQAALSWRLWFGREGPADVMRAALDAFLQRCAGRPGPRPEPGPRPAARG